MKVDITRLRDQIPSKVYDELVNVAVKYKIDSNLRMAHFLAQCAHESGGFKRVEENLNYSLEALLRTFPKYFNPGNTQHYLEQPTALDKQMSIASRVYADRMGNGSEESLEGWLYRGRGYMQLTGKDNYTRFDKEVTDNIVLCPELVATQYPLLSAGWFWNVNHLNDIADLGATENEVARITKVVNGGYHGLEDRTRRFNEIFERL